MKKTHHLSLCSEMVGSIIGRHFRAEGFDVESVQFIDSTGCETTRNDIFRVKATLETQDDQEVKVPE